MKFRNWFPSHASKGSPSSKRPAMANIELEAIIKKVKFFQFGGGNCHGFPEQEIREAWIESREEDC
jgi:hypothetical protein